MKKLILLVLVALLIAACGGGNDPTPAPAAPAAEEPVAGSAQEAIAEVLDVVMHDIYFGEDPDNLNNPPEWTVTAGSEVTVNLVNSGALEHDFSIVKQGAEVPVPFLDANRDLLLFEGGVVAGGQTDVGTFTAPTEPGIYTVICAVAGHYPVMQGRLVVQ